ncbi:LuxR family transcriptional regulator [Pseudonocardia yunnanensis]|uniref:LuxR C-terminal-related transcriptional regulator n=1 Tax=Pseudonocardia yunnanensis TaxID=58107 RepID=A0ABW4F9X0_9PSEU
MMRNRHAECEVLDRLLMAVRAGQSRALVVRGEPGVGKTALLEYVAAQASDCRVERAAGVQSEMEVAFAGLHQLCAPMLGRLGRLPDPQRDALGITFGLVAGRAPDRLLVGLAVLGLLAEVAREQPLVCVVDDAQWLDRASAQVFAFVARRLVAESVALVIGSRGEPEDEPSSGLPELVVAGLPDVDARELLRSALPGLVDERVRDRIIAETRGNPLALLELPRGLTLAELTCGFGSAAPLPRRIEESFHRQLAPLPADTRMLLLVAAAEPLDDPLLVWRATELLGIQPEAAGPASAAGLFEIGTRARFRHPLLRSTIYRTASVEERRIAHRALADAIDPDADPDRRAWHRAQAASGPDEDVAADLERSAGRARARGGLSAAAAFLERAVQLTSEPARRAARALVAAQAAHQAGAADVALELLSVAMTGPLDRLQRAHADMLCAQITFTTDRGGEAPLLLLEAAKQLEPLDVRLARDTYLDALWAAKFAGSSAGVSLCEVAEAARSAPPAAQPPRPADLLLDGMAMRYTEGPAAGVSELKRVLLAFRRPGMTEEDGLRWFVHAQWAAGELGDDETWDVLAARHVQLAREAGALSELPLALTSRILLHVFAGELAAAASLLAELAAVSEVTGSPFLPHSAVVLAAWQGHAAEVAELINTGRAGMLRRGEGVGLTFMTWGEAVLHNSMGRSEEALALATKSAEAHPWENGLLIRGTLAELVEGAVRCGQTERATAALRRLSELSRACGSDWPLGLAARARALVRGGAAAESDYREAIDRLGRTRIRSELARAHLLYGEWLRREHRRVDAREQLRTAHEMFTTMGAEAFAARAERELLATGEQVRKRNLEISSELTAQEAQIARLVRQGLTNPEIAARLFISARTVEWHLKKVFRKLGISSRTQLQP